MAQNHTILGHYVIMKAIIFFALTTSLLQAAEVDHYSKSYEEITEVGTIVNARANTYLQKALTDLNRKSGCNEEELYTELKKYFANHTKGQLAKDLLHDKDIPRTVISLDNSVYGEWSVWNGFLLGRKKARTSPLALGPIIKINGHVIGTDKIEHMFGMGFIYFKKHYLNGQPLTKVLKNGIFKEKTALGGNIVATGVFSYADLSANFNGMRFWNHILQKNDDILGAQFNLGPYVTCANNQWVQEKEIDFSQYIDESMDESVNCSKFASKSGLKKFTQAVETANKSRSIDQQACDSENKSLKSMSQKYDIVIESDSKKRPISHWIINSKGHGKVSYFNEF